MPGRWAPHHSATGQAGMLFALAGALGLLTGLALDSARATDAGTAVNIAAIVMAVALLLAPWHRWTSKSTLLIVPAAFGLLGLGERVSPGSPTVYGVWFVVVFAWIGFWHPPRTCLWFAPVGAAGYLVPFLGAASTPTDAVSSVAIAIPAGVVLGEAIASRMATIERTQRALSEARALLERANVTDDLTGIGNRRHANTLIDSLRPGDGLIVLDLDHFKEINDTRGHAAGDQVLAELGSFLRGVVRSSDTAARLGGDEFLIVVRGGGNRTQEIADRIVSGWRDHDTDTTISIGIATHHNGSPSDTLIAADQALYNAKGRGRDRVVTADPGPYDPDARLALPRPPDLP